MKTEKFVIAVLVSNHFGVLTRVAGLFARRGFNIDSLTVGETENPSISRMTIAVTGDDYVQEQMVKQLEKLHDVKKIAVMEQDETVTRELVLLKVKSDDANRAAVIEAANVYRAKVVDLSPESISIEITGEQTKLDGFIKYMRQYGVLELCRTGVTAIGRGDSTLTISE